MVRLALCTRSGKKQERARTADSEKGRGGVIAVFGADGGGKQLSQVKPASDLRRESESSV